MKLILAQTLFLLSALLTSACAQQPNSQRSPAAKDESQINERETELLRQRATNGDADSQFQMATHLSERLIQSGDDSNLKEIVKWCTLAANQGHHEAQSHLGMLYLDGVGVSKDVVLAEKWLTLGSDGGSVLGMHNLGTIHIEGLTKTPSRQIAKSLFERAAQSDCVESMYSLGLMANESEDYQSAFRWYTTAAEKGHSDAAHNLGVYYLNGNDFIKPSNELAFKWFETSANHGNALAQCALGDMYLQGVGCKQDLAFANKCYRASADQGHANAAFKLGANYAMGIGTLESEFGAMTWFKRAKRNGMDLVSQRDSIQSRIHRGEIDISSRKIIRLIDMAEASTPNVEH